MSQSGLVNIEASHPQIATQYDTDSGSAIPIANVLEVAGGAGVTTTASGNTVTIALTGGGAAIDTISTDYAGPVSPDGAGNISATGTSIFSDGTVANTLTLNVQATENTLLLGAGAGTTATELGPFTNGELLIGSTGAAPVAGSLTSTGGTITVTSGAGTINLDVVDGTYVDSFTTDAGGPVTPSATGVVDVTGTSIFSDGTVANTITLNVQATANTFLLGAGAGSTATELGPLTNGQLIIGSTGVAPALATIASADGSITITNGAGTIDLAVAAADDAILTLTGDTGGALSPTAGNISILGGPGITVTGSGSTLTVNSVVYTDQTATTLAVDSGTFATAAGAYVLPASPAQGDLVEIVCLTTGIVVTANTGQVIFMGNDSSSTAGTATNSAKADSLSMRYRSADSSWYCTSVVGVWSLS